MRFLAETFKKEVRDSPSFQFSLHEIRQALHSPDEGPARFQFSLHEIPLESASLGRRLLSAFNSLFMRFEEALRYLLELAKEHLSILSS